MEAREEDIVEMIWGGDGVRGSEVKEDIGAEISSNQRRSKDDFN